MSNTRKLPKRPTTKRVNESAAQPHDPAGAVAVAYVHRNEVHYSWHHSMMQLIGWDAEHENRVWRGGFIAERGTTGDLAADRNRGVQDFLRDARAEWLLWVDTDMGFEPNSIDRLVEAADPVERPVLGGLCFAQRESEPDLVGGFRPVAWPVIMDWSVIEERGGFQVRWDYPRDAITRCHGIGSAFVLIHRSVFERVQAKYVELSGRKDWADWYRRLENPTTGELVGEDLSFCVRLMASEIPVHVHTGVQTTHFKPIWLQEQDYWRQRALAPAPEETPNLPREQRLTRRYATITSHNRPERLAALCMALARQVDQIVILDNASNPPVDEAALQHAVNGGNWSGGDREKLLAMPGALADPETRVKVIRDEQQPPHIYRFWNVLWDWCEADAKFRGLDVWDVAYFNDDAVLPSGWFDICSTVLRGHDKAVVAHTGATPVHRHELVDAYPYPREKRMCPWAFVVKGEAGLRADERFHWFYGDDAFNMAAIEAGGVLAAPGPLVINALAVQSTQQRPELAALAEQDRLTFEATWGQKL